MRVLPKWDAAFLLTLVRNINAFQEGEAKNPHKALLLLLVLERFKQTGGSLVSYSEVWQPLKELIQEHSASRYAHPEYPFWYLQNDHLFEVYYESGLQFRKGKDFPPHSQMLKCNAVGKLPFWIEKIFKKNGELLVQIERIVAKGIQGTDADKVLADVSKICLEKTC